MYATGKRSTMPLRIVHLVSSLSTFQAEDCEEQIKPSDLRPTTYVVHSIMSYLIIFSFQFYFAHIKNNLFRKMLTVGHISKSGHQDTDRNPHNERS
jgi:hypothetical protein